MAHLKATSPLHIAAPPRRRRWHRVYWIGFIRAVGIICIIGSAIGLILAHALYTVMSTFPVPGAPVPPVTGPGLGDVIIFVGIGLVGVFGIVLVFIPSVIRNADPVL